MALIGYLIYFLEGKPDREHNLARVQLQMEMLEVDLATVLAVVVGVTCHKQFDLYFSLQRAQKDLETKHVCEFGKTVKGQRQHFEIIMMEHAGFLKALKH